jgi:hypothetical protein
VAVRGVDRIEGIEIIDGIDSIESIESFDSLEIFKAKSAIGYQPETSLYLRKAVMVSWTK